MLNSILQQDKREFASPASKTNDSAHRRLIISLVCLIAVASGALVLFVFNPAQSSFYPFCVFHRITGLQCPGCGSLRAMHQLLHGHIVEAARLNLLLVLCLPCLGWRTMRFATTRLRGQPATFTIQPGWLWTFLCVAVVFTV